MNPSMVRTNHRFRGPVETVKHNMHREAAYGDVSRLGVQIEKLRDRLSGLSTSLRDGATYESPQSLATASESMILTGITGHGQFAYALGTLSRELDAKGGNAHG